MTACSCFTISQALGRHTWSPGPSSELPVLGREKHGHTGASPVKGHKDDEGTGASDDKKQWGQIELQDAFKCEKKLLYCKGVETLDHIAQRGCGVSILRDIQNLTGDVCINCIEDRGINNQAHAFHHNKLSHKDFRLFIIDWHNDNGEKVPLGKINAIRTAESKSVFNRLYTLMYTLDVKNMPLTEVFQGKSTYSYTCSRFFRSWGWRDVLYIPRCWLSNNGAEYIIIRGIHIFSPEVSRSNDPFVTFRYHELLPHKNLWGLTVNRKNGNQD
ncbi:hypothetical protein QYF61_012846 [Mycteria americana]|uniref:Uncharacterized protein n=1 Tax=Mycteria americana TaxID=33587 RepID=A0AAN7PEX5_MYCAM|nr:hypothetical protein QYF61_012846 [Mycteria americana]